MSLSQADFDYLRGLVKQRSAIALDDGKGYLVVSAFLRHSGVACLDRRRMPLVLDFWRGKSTIYERFINREDVILWESAWSATLQRCCAGVSLADPLEVSEDELVSAAQRQGLPSVSRVIRYKEPQEYIINGALDALPPEPPVSELWRVLRREPVGTSHECATPPSRRTSTVVPGLCRRRPVNTATNSSARSGRSPMGSSQARS